MSAVIALNQGLESIFRVSAGLEGNPKFPIARTPPDTFVGQDTDGLSNPLEAGLDGLVKLDKEDFIGKTSLLFASAARSVC